MPRTCRGSWGILALMARECQHAATSPPAVGPVFPLDPMPPDSSQPPICWPLMKICGIVVRPPERRFASSRAVDPCGASISWNSTCLVDRDVYRPFTKRAPWLGVYFDLGHLSHLSCRNVGSFRRRRKTVCMARLHGPSAWSVFRLPSRVRLAGLRPGSELTVAGRRPAATETDYAASTRTNRRRAAGRSGIAA